MLDNQVPKPDGCVTIHMSDIVVGKVKEIAKIKMYFNILHQQIKFNEEIEKFGYGTGTKIIIVHAPHLGPGVFVMTKAGEAEIESATITKNSNKSGPGTHKYCLSGHKKLFNQFNFAKQPPSSRTRKDGTKGEKGFTIEAKYIKIENAEYSGENRNGFLMNLSSYLEENQYENIHDLNVLGKN